MLFFKSDEEKRKQQRIDDLEDKIAKLQTERSTLKEQVCDLQYTKKKDEEEIKHLVKMKQEKLQLEKDREIMNIKAECAEEVAKVKDQYRDKAEKQLSDERDNIKQMYTEILQRLPNVNVNMKGNV